MYTIVRFNGCYIAAVVISLVVASFFRMTNIQCIQYSYSVTFSMLIRKIFSLFMHYSSIYQNSQNCSHIIPTSLIVVAIYSYHR